VTVPRRLARVFIGDEPVTQVPRVVLVCAAEGP
jgi:hypothetical protein